MFYSNQTEEQKEQTQADIVLYFSIRKAVIERLWMFMQIRIFKKYVYERKYDAN